VTAAAAALLASTTPRRQTHLSTHAIKQHANVGIAIIAHAPTPVLSMLPRCASSLSKIREKTRVRPLPRCPYSTGTGYRRLHNDYNSTAAVATTTAPIATTATVATSGDDKMTATTAAHRLPPRQSCCSQIDYIYLRRRKRRKRSTAPLIVIVITPVAAAELIRSRVLWVTRRRRAQDKRFTSPYTSQYLDSDNDNDNP